LCAQRPWGVVLRPWGVAPTPHSLFEKSEAKTLIKNFVGSAHTREPLKRFNPNF